LVEKGIQQQTVYRRKSSRKIGPNPPIYNYTSSY